MSVLRLTTITLSLILLVACGGGGGGSGGGSGTPITGTEPLPPSLISDPAEVRGIIQAINVNDDTRGLAPDFTPTQVRDGLARISMNGNALLLREAVSAGTMFSASRMIHCVGAVMCQGDITTIINGETTTRTEDYVITDIAGPLLIGDEEDFAGFNGQFSAVMTDRGVRLAQVRAAGRAPIEEGGTPVRHTFQNYSGWLDISAFTVQLQRQGSAFGLGAYSFGMAPGPSTMPRGSGSVAWTGVMAGAFENGDNDVVHGDAMIDIDDLSSPDVDVVFTNIKNLDNGNDVEDIMWSGLTLTDGTFEDTTDSIQGVFYGSNYEEVGGIFDRDNVIGAFGARRTEILPGYAITDLPAARTLVAGTAPASMTEAQIVAGIQTRATAADTFEFSNFEGTPDVTITCSNNSSCSGNIPNAGTLAFSLTDIEDLSLVDDTNLVGFNSDSQAVMVDEGVTIIQSQAAARDNDGTQLSFQTYGGWLSGSVFGVELLDVTENTTTTNRFASFSFGNKTGSNPTANARWDGVMVGVAKNDGDIIQGEATIQWDNTTPSKVSGLFNNIRNLTEGGNASMTLMTLNNLDLMDGAFTSTNAFVTIGGSISGNFYGEGHAEVGGTFDTDDIIGAFGAKK